MFFSLGFVHVPTAQKFFIVCNGKCLFNQSLQGIDPNTYQPLISDMQFLPDFISVPEESQYKKVSLRTANLSMLSIQEKLGFSKSNEHENLLQCQHEYKSRDQFVEILRHFVEVEQKESQNIQSKRVISKRKHRFSQ